jgi:hypothetical protein
MRTKFAPQLYIDFSGKSSLKVVNEYRTKYYRMSQTTLKAMNRALNEYA